MLDFNLLAVRARHSIRALGRSNQFVVESIMDNYTAGELQEAVLPIVSLISKSEKAQRRLAPGTWQHTMLRDNLKALRQALDLINNETNNTNNFTRDDLREALHAFASMISKTEKALSGFSPGTSQHTLQRNRLKALHIAETLIKLELDGLNERA
jgi:hypothetical protein